jgi:uncharacterized protein (TIGR02452 family)
MIKRDGVELMNERTSNVKLAKQTLEILKQGAYTAPSGQVVDITNILDAALAGTILYKEQLPNKDYTFTVPVVEVVNETTTQAVRRLAAKGKTNIVALNFASARNVGGGFLGGAIAQEEDLCRSSGLYACTKSKPQFYNDNILCEDALYTDNVIYSPQVPFFRDDQGQFLEEPYLLSIISAPAPNFSGLKKEDGLKPLVKGIFRERAIKVLQIAAEHEHKTIVLGAWGCGAFGNDPEMVAQVFKDVLPKVPVFEHVCFAVYDTRPETPVYETFRKKFC